jgi:hypothetical protein
MVDLRASNCITATTLRAQDGTLQYLEHSEVHTVAVEEVDAFMAHLGSAWMLGCDRRQ